MVNNNISMPDTANDSIEDKLARLKLNYASSLPARLDKLSALWQQADHSEDRGEFHESLIREFHTLAGSGSSFGFPEVTRLAREIEHALQDGQTGTSESLADFVNQRIQALQAIARQEPTKAQPAEAQTMTDNAALQENRRVFVYVDEPQHIDELQDQLQHYGYRVELFDSLARLQSALQQRLPGVMVVSVQHLDEASRELLLQYQHNDLQVPVIILSRHNDTQHRLDAVRAGASAFFTWPLDYSRFIDTLDHLTSHSLPDPFRILIVDDAKSSADFYARTLQEAGMHTDTVNDPLDVIQHIQDFCPELILMDIYMPNCHGTELAAVIRQDESYVGTPVVYLSSETRADKQQIAMAQGGDDFLTKPIKPEHLVSAVRNRASRYRKLRSFMVRDSLTGLYNHTSTKELLAHELAQAVRNGSALSYVMLDIDHFKTVNDRYGHAMGDRVIKILARLLKQRLRCTDIIGRYGGEEFAIILPDTPLEAAHQVIDDIRGSFENIRLSQNDVNFHVSFSAGIAVHPVYTDAITLNDAADRALYQAKQNGRNRIETQTR